MAQRLDEYDSTAEAETTQSVVVITNEHMIAAYEAEAAKPIDPDAASRSAFDESVWGYPTDQPPQRNGTGEVKEVVDIINAAGTPCCLVAEPALIYYGTGRVMNDWHICVPSEQLEKTVNLFRVRTARFESFKRSKRNFSGRIYDLYPRFKFIGLRLFFYIEPSYARHLEIIPKHIEFSAIGLPYPTLPVYAQSLLDGGLQVDLEDLIDGMNLTLEWGQQHLHLEGTLDGDWIWWRVNAAYGHEGNEGDKSSWYSNPDKRLDAWAKMATPEAKRMRQGWKYQPCYETRFRKVGSKDPRLRDRNYC